MKSFKEFNIKPVQQGLIGEKISVDRILNKRISVFEYRIVDSKYPEKGNGKCLHLQIQLEDTMKVVFTGSVVLQEIIGQVAKEDFPFETTIVKENRRLEFR